jgi:hypothetical protein
MALSTAIANCQNPGINALIYYNVASTDACDTPIFVEHEGIVGDLNIGMVDDEEELTRRSSTTFFKEYSPGKTEANVTGQQVPDGNYEGNVVLNGAIRGGDPVDLLILNDDIDTQYAYGLRGKFYNFDRSLSAPATGEQEQTFSLKPAACSDCPVRYVKVAVAGTAADWDPTTYTLVSTS